jgi:3,4-dihydroxy 2-butanone 4-phosphate synthase/GTP cyclohydrolase II
MSNFDTAHVERALRGFALGQPVLILDDPSRENEGDLAVAAQFATPAAINFMIREARGLVCVPMLGRRLDELGLPLMTDGHADPNTARFTVSVDARVDVSSGISARDRALTVRALIHPRSVRADFVAPGHTFPLRCADGGLTERQGHTEAAIALACEAGLYPAAVICEVLDSPASTGSASSTSATSRRTSVSGRCTRCAGRAEVEIPYGPAQPVLRRLL